MSDDDELALIRRKKMAELIARERQMQAEREHRMRVESERSKLLRRFLTPDAFLYLQDLKKREPSVGNKVEDVLLYLIVYRGLRQTIEQLDVIYIERQIKGESPKIRIQRDGETTDFGTYVREAIKKQDLSEDNKM